MASTPVVLRATMHTPLFFVNHGLQLRQAWSWHDSWIPLAYGEDIEEDHAEDFLCVLYFLGEYRVLSFSSSFVWALYIFWGAYRVSSNLSNLATIISILRLILMQCIRVGGRSFRSTKEKIFFVVTFGNLSYHLSFTMIKYKRQWTNSLHDTSRLAQYAHRQTVKRILWHQKSTRKWCLISVELGEIYKKGCRCGPVRD